MKDLLNYPLNIQLFADADNEDTGADDNNQGNEDGANEKTFTQAEVDALVAREKARAKRQARIQPPCARDEDGRQRRFAA